MNAQVIPLRRVQNEKTGLVESSEDGASSENLSLNVRAKLSPTTAICPVCASPGSTDGRVFRCSEGHEAELPSRPYLALRRWLRAFRKWLQRV